MDKFKGINRNTFSHFYGDSKFQTKRPIKHYKSSKYGLNAKDWSTYQSHKGNKNEGLLLDFTQIKPPKKNLAPN